MESGTEIDTVVVVHMATAVAHRVVAGSWLIHKDLVGLLKPDHHVGSCFVAFRPGYREYQKAVAVLVLCILRIAVSVQILVVVP